MTFSCTTAFVTLAVVDLEALVLFYTKLLGQEPLPYVPHSYAEFKLPDLRIGIFKPKQAHQSEFSSSKGGMSLCLEVPDLESAIAHLTTLGHAPPGKISTASHGREIYAYDPAGNRLILHQSIVNH